ncbi:MAG: cell division protein ZapA [Candidatus Glassbacteria bacterium]|nr:cell division protein ZapA [Candidatus Glassbacteria bacterium]
MVDDKSTSMRVTIFGETYNIKSQADQEYTVSVAEHVDRTMKLIKGQVGMQDPLKIAILASMSITDDLFQTRDKVEKQDLEIENRCNSLLNLVEAYLDEQTEQEPVKS